MRQPKDPFNGAGHYVPRKPRKAVSNTPNTRKAKPIFASAEVTAKLDEIRQAADAAIARVDVLDVIHARQDFVWIRDLAGDGLRAG